MAAILPFISAPGARLAAQLTHSHSHNQSNFVSTQNTARNPNVIRHFTHNPPRVSQLVFIYRKNAQSFQISLYLDWGQSGYRPFLLKLDPRFPRGSYCFVPRAAPDHPPPVVSSSPTLSLPSALSQLPSVTPPTHFPPLAAPISPLAIPSNPHVAATINQATLDAIVAAFDARHPNHSDATTNTDSSLCLQQFSAALIKTLTQSDDELQSVMQAVRSRNAAHRAALTEYWRSILDDLHIVDDCLFLEEKIVISLEPSFRTLRRPGHEKQMRLFVVPSPL